MRVGQGFDTHRLVKGRKLVLVGVEIAYPFGLLGHSDADVAAHAVIDALLGAAGLGDIGMHFPDSDPTYKDISSIELVETTCDAIRSLGYRMVNVDVTIVAQEPKLGRHRAAMVQNLAEATGLEADRVNVKATTTEGLGFTGRGEGIAAFAVAMIEKAPEPASRG